MTCMRYSTLHTGNFTAPKRPCSECKITSFKLWDILVLLDLSAAFDTIDHHKLLNLLKHSFGIRGNALSWFQSYLQDRTQTVQIGSSTSEPVTLKYGVPQGSVLGPVLFTMYTSPLGNIIRDHGLNFHLYVDDTYMYNLSQMITYPGRTPYPRSKHASRTSKLGWPTTC